MWNHLRPPRTRQNQFWNRLANMLFFTLQRALLHTSCYLKPGVIWVSELGKDLFRIAKASNEGLACPRSLDTWYPCQAYAGQANNGHIRDSGPFREDYIHIGVQVWWWTRAGLLVRQSANIALLIESHMNRSTRWRTVQSKSSAAAWKTVLQNTPMFAQK